MSDVGTGVFAKGRVVPEDVVALSVFPFGKKHYNPRQKLHPNPQAHTLAKEREYDIRRNNGKLRRRRNM